MPAAATVGPLARTMGCHCVHRGIILQSLPVSCHFRGCKAPLFRIVSGAISSELALPFTSLPELQSNILTSLCGTSRGGCLARKTPLMTPLCGEEITCTKPSWKRLIACTFLLLGLYMQRSHTSWKVLDFFFLKIPGPGKSWKITLVLDSPGN